MNAKSNSNLILRRGNTATGANRNRSTKRSRSIRNQLLEEMLRAARSRRPSLPEIVLWSTASQHPSESQTSECSDLLSRSRATFLIVAQRQPGKLFFCNQGKSQGQRQKAVTGVNTEHNFGFECIFNSTICAGQTPIISPR